MKRKRCGFIISLWVLLCLPQYGFAAIFEQMAIDSRSATLGNAVTADPEGALSVHYNPAGLDRVSGSEFNMGLFYIPVLDNKGHFTQGTDPATGKPWAPFGGWFNHGIDPVAGRDTHTDPAMALPFIGILDMAIAPNQGFAHHDKDSPFAYGVALYPPFAAGMRHNDLNDPYRFLGALSSITRLVASPGVSYRVSNTLSVGASVGLGMTFMAFETRMRTPNDMVAMTGALGEATKGLEIPVISELTLPAPWFGGGLSPYEDVGGLKFFAQDLFNASYNVGLLWDPYSWFSFGAVYQSETDADLKGKYTFDYSPRMQKTINWMGSSPMTIIIAAMLGLPTSCPAQESGTMSTNIVFPQRVQFGIKFQPHPKIKFLVDANWADWAAWKTNTITFDRDMKQMQMAKLMGYTGGNRTLTEVNDFKNVWYLGYGLELKPSDHFTLRLGYEFRPSSVNDQYFGPLPQGDVSLYSIGIGFDKPAAEVPARRIKGFEAFQKQLLHPDHIDLGFTFMTGNYTVHYNQSKLMNSTNFTDIVYNPFAGLIYHQTTTSYIISLNQIFKF